CRTASGRVLAVMICAAEDPYVAADVRTIALQNRAADRAYVLFDPTFDDHIAAERDHAVFDLTANDDRAPEANHIAARIAFDDERCLVIRVRLRLVLRADSDACAAAERADKCD